MLLLLLLSTLLSTAFAADSTPLVGTWSSGSKQVVPGPGFANPAQTTFTYPGNTGVGYSFSDDGWYELARYRFAPNGSRPDCVIGTVVWAHGHYAALDNGSLVLTPNGDGYQQVQSPCTHDSNFIQNYNFTETMSAWRIFADPTFGPKLHLFQEDGTPVAPLFRLSEQPNMLPKEQLRNVPQRVVTVTKDGMVSTETLPSSKRKRQAEVKREESRGWLW